jgi:FKBP-type peptidyl-prolyl cis-trans isomerase SlpA
MKRAGGELVTLHYRIGLDDGTEVLSTFGGNPATLALGGGELSPGLERCLAQVVEMREPGRRCVFELEPREAFGEYRGELVQVYPRSAFAQVANLEAGSVFEFSAPDGASRAGLVQAVDEEQVRVDFNHPLAGKRVRFEVEVLSALGGAETTSGARA